MQSFSNVNGVCEDALGPSGLVKNPVLDWAGKMIL